MGKKSIPMLDFDTTLKFVRQLNDNYQDRLISQDDILKMLGLKNANTRSYTHKMTYAKDLGLLENNGSEMIQLTKLSKKIIYPESENQKEINDLKIKAFENSEFNQELLNRFEKTKEPTEVTLANVLLNEFGVKDNLKNQAASSYLNSLSQLGLDNVNDKPVDKKSESNNEITEDISLFDSEDAIMSDAENSQQIDNNISNNAAIKENKAELISLDYDINFSIKNSQTNVIIQIPRNMVGDKKQLELTKKMIDAQIDTLLE